MDWLTGWSLSSRQNSLGYVRRPCYGHIHLCKHSSSSSSSSSFSSSPSYLEPNSGCANWGYESAKKYESFPHDCLFIILSIVKLLTSCSYPGSQARWCRQPGCRGRTPSRHSHLKHQPDKIKCVLAGPFATSPTFIGETVFQWFWHQTFHTILAPVIDQIEWSVARIEVDQDTCG